MQAKSNVESGQVYTAKRSVHIITVGILSKWKNTFVLTHTGECSQNIGSWTSSYRVFSSWLCRWFLCLALRAYFCWTFVVFLKFVSCISSRRWLKWFIKWIAIFSAIQIKRSSPPRPSLSVYILKSLRKYIWGGGVAIQQYLFHLTICYKFFKIYVTIYLCKMSTVLYLIRT